MALPSSRITFREFCLRKLGKNVIELNLDPDQIEDRIDEAIQFWQEYNSNALIRTYLPYQITTTDITNKYIPMDSNVIFVNRIFPINTASGSGGRVNMFNFKYQYFLNDFNRYSPEQNVDYYLMMRTLTDIDMMFGDEVPIDYNRYTDRIVPHWNWDDIQAGDYLLVECYITVDFDTYSSLWSDRMLMKYATALLKYQWGWNLTKFNGVQLLDGVALNGDAILNEAKEEIKDVEEEMRNSYDEPLGFFVG